MRNNEIEKKITELKAKEDLTFCDVLELQDLMLEYLGPFEFTDKVLIRLNFEQLIKIYNEFYRK